MIGIWPLTIDSSSSPTSRSRLLSDLSDQTGRSPQMILSEALRQYHLARANRADNGSNRETVYDAILRAGLIGCIKGGPADLSTNPQYMEGFGESDY